MRIQNVTLLVLFVLCILLSIPAGPALADRRYVSDMLILTLREGPGNEYEVIRTLRTGTPIEVLEEGERYLRVRTEEGEEGWVAKQYITSDTPKPLIMAGLEKENERLEAKVQELQKKETLLLNQLKEAAQGHDANLKELEKDAEKYRQEVSRATAELEQITEKYDALLEQSKNVVAVAGERDRLQAENAKLVDEMNRLKKENTRLQRTRVIQWFLAGAGVLLIGLIAGRVTTKKRYY
jgi:SH3 domain protein